MDDRPEIILCTLGTRGDIEPFLALARQLRRRGYVVTLLTNANWAAAARAAGAEFHAIAEGDEPQSGRDDYRFFLGNTLPSFERSYRIVATRAAQGRPMMLVYRVNMLGMQCAAERFGLPNARVALQPSVIKSFERPPWPMSIAVEGRLGWLGRRLVVPALYAAGEVSSRYRSHTNRFRRSLDLPAQGLLRRRIQPEDFVLMMCPAWFAMPQSDWPEDVYLVGFPYADISAPDVELRQFIGRRDAPVVFTPGTGVTDTAAFFDKGAELLARLGIPGIFLSAEIPERHRQDPNIACRNYADLGWLLPRARAFVHHGGIGSTAQALRAGIPQLVVPGRFDQPDNAVRIAKLGLGAAVLSARFAGSDWADLLQRTFDSAHVRMQLTTAAQLIAAEDAIENSVDVIEHFLERRLGRMVLAA